MYCNDAFGTAHRAHSSMVWASALVVLWLPWHQPFKEDQRGSKRIVCHFLRAQVGEGFEVKCAGDLMGKDCPGLRYEAISFWQYCTCSYFCHRGHPVRLVNTPRPLDVRNFRIHCHLCQRFRCSFYLISIHMVSM